VPIKNPSHFLVLNKFPIIKNHFILATKAEKPQTALLEADDLATTYAVLYEWYESADENNEQVFAFFNSGSESGASQAHRHIQFLPVLSMEQCDGLEQESAMGNDSVMEVDSNIEYDTATEHGSDTGFWEPLMSTIIQKESKGVQVGLPFAYFWAEIPHEPSPETLLATYLDLHRKADAAMQEYTQENPEYLTADGPDSGHSFSYNLGMTRSGMILCPRRKEGLMLTDADGLEVGFVALNGTLLGGTLMVKNEKLFEYMQTEAGALDKVLGAIGLPSQYASGAGATKL
jgi:sulfate adenylyltransferase (ADP) / ATP adenylyltransferase